MNIFLHFFCFWSFLVCSLVEPPALCFFVSGLLTYSNFIVMWPIYHSGSASEAFLSLSCQSHHLNSNNASHSHLCSFWISSNANQSQLSIFLVFPIFSMNSIREMTKPTQKNKWHYAVYAYENLTSYASR